MTESELRKRFLDLLPALAAWGEFVKSTVADRVAASLNLRGDARAIDDFLKLPPKLRLKSEASFVAKALNRGKNYTDPLARITDLVGIRFVVLLSSETQIIDSAITTCPEWETSQDRAFEQDRRLRPYYFEYESNHFIVRNLKPRLIASSLIPLGLPCEIQVRTLLQHAYAELSHDRLYKPECKVPDSVHRLVARGSALLETTDHVFCQVSDGIAAALESRTTVHSVAAKLCVTLGIAPRDSDPQVTFTLLEQFPEAIPSMTAAAFDELLRKRTYIPNRMRIHKPESILFSHPAGLIAYWLVDRLETGAISKWPFDRELIEIIGADLGIVLV